MASELRTGDGFLTVPAAAKQLGRAKMTLYRWIEAKTLIAVKFGGILFVPVSEVERLANAKKERGTEDIKEEGGYQLS